MSVLSGLLPVEQGVACLARLRQHTDTWSPRATPAPATRSWPTPSSSASPDKPGPTDVTVEVGIVIPADTLLDPDQGSAAAASPATAPSPAPIAHDLLTDTHGRRWWRRLFTTPGGGLIGADPRRRCFDGVLAHLIRVRDSGRCRDPFCDAPRHVDHIRPHRRVDRPARPTDAACAPAASAPPPDRTHLHQPRRTVTA
jgi:hypothetical protein